MSIDLGTIFPDEEGVAIPDTLLPKCPHHFLDIPAGVVRISYRFHGFVKNVGKARDSEDLEECLVHIRNLPFEVGEAYPVDRGGYRHVHNKKVLLCSLPLGDVASHTLIFYNMAGLIENCPVRPLLPPDIPFPVKNPLFMGEHRAFPVKGKDILLHIVPVTLIYIGQEVFTKDLPTLHTQICADRLVHKRKIEVRVITTDELCLVFHNSPVPGFIYLQCLFIFP